MPKYGSCFLFDHMSRKEAEIVAKDVSTFFNREPTKKEVFKLKQKMLYELWDKEGRDMRRRRRNTRAHLMLDAEYRERYNARMRAKYHRRKARECSIKTTLLATEDNNNNNNNIIIETVNYVECCK